MNYDCSAKVRRWLVGSASAALFLSAAVTALHASEIQPPADPVARAALEVLDRSCSRCHQEGRLVGRDSPASGFVNILKLDEIGKNREEPHRKRLSTIFASFKATPRDFAVCRTRGRIRSEAFILVPMAKCFLAVAF